VTEVPNFDRTVSALRSRFSHSQPTLYVVAGALGAVAGLVGAGAAVLIMLIVFRAIDILDDSEYLTSVILTVQHFGIFASVLGTSLFFARHVHRRQGFTRRSLLKAVVLALMAGAITGGLIQALHNGVADSNTPFGGVVVVSSWIMTSALVGKTLSRFVPNLDPMRGLLAGLLGGLLAGSFGVAAIAMGMGASIISSFIGYVIACATLGFAMWIFECHIGQATLEVLWTPMEGSRFALGPEPMTIGGQGAHVLVPNAPAQVSSIELKGGQIEHVETANQKRTTLRDGSRLRVGDLIMVVRAASATSPLRVSPRKQAE
jgi:hypothetical protein